jgi:hypothetical protein
MLQVMRDRGITPETEVVTYCTIGNRASQAWFALKYLLGYHDVRVLLRLVDRMGKGYRHADRTLIGPLPRSLKIATLRRYSLSPCSCCATFERERDRVT